VSDLYVLCGILAVAFVAMIVVAIVIFYG